MGPNLLLLLLIDAARAGVWIREPEHPYLQLGGSYQQARRTFDASGQPRDAADERFLGVAGELFGSGRFEGLEASAYAELGLGHGVELVGSLPVRAVRNRWEWATGAQPPIVHDNHGFGDASLGLRVGGQVDSVALSVLVAARVPLYDNDPAVLHVEAGNSDFYDDRVPLGPGTVDLDLTPGVGVPLGWADGWALFEGGVRVRDRQYSAQLPARLQVGLHPASPWATWIQATAVGSLGNGAAPDAFLDAFGKGPVAVDNTSFLELGAGTQVALPRGLAAGATVDRVVLARRFPALTRFGLHLAWTGLPEPP